MRRGTTRPKGRTIDGLLAAHLDEVYGYAAFRLAPNLDAAADVTQEVFAAALRDLPPDRDAPGRRAWLLGVTRHKVIDHLRRRAREGVPLDHAAGSVAALDRRFDSRFDPGDPGERARRERAALVARVMRELPHEQSDVLEELLEGAAEARSRFPERYRVLTWSREVGSALRIDFAGRPGTVDVGDRRLPDYATVRIRMEQFMDLRAVLPAAAPDALELEIVRGWIDGRRPESLYASDGVRTFMRRGPFPAHYLDAERVTAHVTRLARLPLFPADAWPTEYQWPIGADTDAPLERADDGPDAPPGTLGLRATLGDRRTEYFLDPDRDFICLRRIDWQRRGDAWHRERETTLDGLVRLASGAWVATRRTGFSAGRPDHDPPIGDGTWHWTVHVREADFPEGHFDVDALLEEAKALGATVESY